MMTIRRGDELLAGLNEGDVPVMGFVVAGNKRDVDFQDHRSSQRKTIRSRVRLPVASNLQDDLRLAILWLCSTIEDPRPKIARIYISENHMCFRANILGWVADVLERPYLMYHLSLIPS